MRDHTSTSDDRPVTGADWEYYWTLISNDGSAVPAWQAAMAYTGDYASERIPLQVQVSANCWAKNIGIERCGSRCVQLFYDNYRFEMRDSHIARCINRQDSNNCYGTLVGMYNSGLLIENGPGLGSPAVLRSLTARFQNNRKQVARQGLPVQSNSIR